MLSVVPMATSAYNLGLSSVPSTRPSSGADTERCSRDMRTPVSNDKFSFASSTRSSSRKGVAEHVETTPVTDTNERERPRLRFQVGTVSSSARTTASNMNGRTTGSTPIVPLKSILSRRPKRTPLSPSSESPNGAVDLIDGAEETQRPRRRTQLKRVLFKPRITEREPAVVEQEARSQTPQVPLNPVQGPFPSDFVRDSISVGANATSAVVKPTIAPPALPRKAIVRPKTTVSTRLLAPRRANVQVHDDLTGMGAGHDRSSWQKNSPGGDNLLRTNSTGSLLPRSFVRAPRSPGGARHLLRSRRWREDLDSPRDDETPARAVNDEIEGILKFLSHIRDAVVSVICDVPKNVLHMLQELFPGLRPPTVLAIENSTGE